jgi:peptidoglycan/LPS O-acetylase OafA/YrhL
MFVIWPMVVLFQRSGLTPKAAPWLFLVTTALTGLLGWMIARLYSEPLNRWLRSSLVRRRISTTKMAAGN